MGGDELARRLVDMHAIESIPVHHAPTPKSLRRRGPPYNRSETPYIVEKMRNDTISAGYFLAIQEGCLRRNPRCFAQRLLFGNGIGYLVLPFGWDGAPGIYPLLPRLLPVSANWPHLQMRFGMATSRFVVIYL